MSAQRHEDDDCTPAEPSWRGHDSTYIDSAEAAELLGLSRRQVQRLANGLDSVRVGSIWMLRRATVLAHKARREAQL